MDGIPVHPDEVTPEWLGSILGGKVSNVSWKPIGTGQVGDSVRFTLQGPDVGTKIPATLAGKFPAADETSRATAALFGLYRKEVRFYKDAASKLDVRAPRVHFAQTCDEGQRFCLIFEDLGPARQGDQIAGCSLDDAREAIRQAAAIHAPSWGRRDMLEADWIQPAPDIAERVDAMYPQAQAIFHDRYKDLLEPQFMSICDEFAGLTDRYHRSNDQQQCLVHGDFRLDNMLFGIRGGAEPIAILDWQTVTSGKAMTDIGYFLGCGIGQLGLDHEDELLELYLNDMTARGVSLTRQTIDHDYRVGILHGVTTAVFSAAFVERTQRGDANFLSMARGACALALKHDSIAALKEAS